MYGLFIDEWTRCENGGTGPNHSDIEHPWKSHCLTQWIDYIKKEQEQILKKCEKS